MFALMAAVNLCPAFGLLCGEPFESAEYYEDEDILFKSSRKVQTEMGWSKAVVSYMRIDFGDGFYCL